MAYTDNGDGTITGKTTGLIWQKDDAGEMTWEKAKDYASSLKLGGHGDWRLPTSMELFSIVNHSRHRTPLDISFFTRTDANYWWTSSPLVNDSSKIWIVNAGGGIGVHRKSETVSAGGDRWIHVRCVRRKVAFGSGPKLKKSGDGNVTDTVTGLVWQEKGEASPMTWLDGLSYCSQLKLAEFEDWRTPNIKELRFLSDHAKFASLVDLVNLPTFTPNSYWSSTSESHQPMRTWYVNFRSGLVTYADKPTQQMVIALRGGGVAEPKSRQKDAPDPHLFDIKPPRQTPPRGGGGG